jgi:hypothetical protein
MKRGVRVELWGDCEGSQLGQRRSASRHQGQHGCHGEKKQLVQEGFVKITE